MPDAAATLGLPPALMGDRADLSETAKAEIMGLSKPNGARFLAEALMAWIVVFGAVAIGVYAQNIWVNLLVICVIATRQNVLGLLIHEQAHHSGLKGKYSDLIANIFAGYPLLVLTAEGYAQVHLMHHKFYFLENDPDHLRKSGPDWEFPMKPGKLARILLTDILGLNVIKLVTGKRLDGPDRAFRRRPPRWSHAMTFIRP